MENKEQVKNNGERINKTDQNNKKEEHYKQDNKNNEISELKVQIETLNLENREKQEKINQLTKHISDINASYMEKVQEKAKQANDLLNTKVKELQDKFNQEVSEIKKYALSSSMEEFLNIFNQFESMVNHQTDDPKINNYLTGFKMFIDMFHNWMNDMHIMKMDIKIGDEFDVHCMQAIDVDKDEESKHPFKVTKVITSGYKLYDRVIVNAKVNVSNCLKN